MHKSESKIGYISPIISIAIVSITAMAFTTASPKFILSTENAVVIGTKWRELSTYYDYIFMHDTSIVFEAPKITDWTLDHIEIDFGCEVGAVTGSNVSDIFTIDNGYIQVCRPG